MTFQFDALNVSIGKGILKVLKFNINFSDKLLGTFPLLSGLCKSKGEEGGRGGLIYTL